MSSTLECSNESLLVSERVSAGDISNNLIKNKLNLLEIIQFQSHVQNFPVLAMIIKQRL